MGWSECGGCEWLGYEGNKVCFEGYSMERGKEGVEEGDTGAPQVGIRKLIEKEYENCCRMVKSQRQRRK